MSSKNFGEREMSLLTCLIDKYKNIICNKTTNAFVNGQKEAAWRKLTEEFNANSGEVARTQPQLINKFRNMKKIANKRKSKDKVSIFATGGGPGKLMSTPLDDQLNAMGVVTQPSENEYDCDAPYECALNNQVSDQMSTAEPSYIEVTVMGTEMNEDDGLQMEVSDFLRTPGPHSADTLQLSSTPNTSLTGSRVPLVAVQNTAPLVIEKVEPQKRVPLVKGARRRPNTSEKAVNSLVEAAQKREAVLSMELEFKRKECEQRLLQEKAEHDVRMRVEETKLHTEGLKVKVEEERLKTLTAKRLYYEFLTKK